MANINYTELFYSIQGEGRFVGVPSIFLRTFGCNFKCNSFGCAAPVIGHNPEVIEIIKNIDQYKTFNDLPLVTTGCDSYSTVYPEFKRFANKESTSEIVDRMLALTPNNKWMQDNSNDVHLVITGGEPLLGWQRAYGELFEHPRMQDIRNITFETNGTQLLNEDFKATLDALQMEGDREITFSVSAKLSTSGERWEDAIKPEIVRSYELYGVVYLKFVVEKPSDFDEVGRAVKAYRDAGFTGVVYIMPVGGVVSVYDGNKFNVADEALKRGYYYSPRLHIDLFGNAWNT